MRRPHVLEHWWYLVSSLTVAGRPLRLIFYVTLRTLRAEHGLPIRFSVAHDFWQLISVEDRQHWCAEHVCPARAFSYDPERFTFRLKELESREADGHIALRLALPDGRLSLMLSPEKPLIPQFRNSEDAEQSTPRSVSWVYPRLRVHGSLSSGSDGPSEEVTGIAWYDRARTPVHPYTMRDPHQWANILFDDHSELMVFVGPWEYAKDVYGIYVDPNGIGRTLSRQEFQWVPSTSWRSPLTGIRYPVAWNFSSCALGLEFTARAFFPEQEIVGKRVVSARLWCGAGRVHGTRQGRPIKGDAFFGVNGKPRLLKRLLLACTDAAFLPLCALGVFSASPRTVSDN